MLAVMASLTSCSAGEQLTSTTQSLAALGDTPMCSCDQVAVTCIAAKPRCLPINATTTVTRCEPNSSGECVPVSVTLPVSCGISNGKCVNTEPLIWTSESCRWDTSSLTGERLCGDWGAWHYVDDSLLCTIKKLGGQEGWVVSDNCSDGVDCESQQSACSRTHLDPTNDCRPDPRTEEGTCVEN
jgi:hypothetical protein